MAWVFTGAGLMTAAGDAADALYAAVTAGKALASGAGAATAPVQGFDATSYLQRKGVRDFSRTSQLACAAAAGNAKGLAGVPVDEVGVVFGSAWGSLKTVVDFERQAFVQGPRFVDPILFTETVANVPAGQVAIVYGWSAFNSTVSAGSASGLAAVLRAVDFLEEARGRVAVAGGGDELDLPLALAARGAGHEPASIGEAACLLTIEAEEHARARGAAALARYRGGAMRFENRAAESAGAVRGSIEQLLSALIQKTALAPGDIDLVVLSSAGAARADAEEVEAVREVCGSGPKAPATCAPKLVVGETWGASGALALVVALEAMRAGYAAGGAKRTVRNAIVLDRSASGHQIGVALAAPEARA